MFESGDADGTLRPTDSTVPLTWVPGTPDLELSMMYLPDGSPFMGDPRHALVSVLDRHAARGWALVCAVELEFFLVKPTVHWRPQSIQRRSKDQTHRYPVDPGTRSIRSLL